MRRQVLLFNEFCVTEEVTKYPYISHNGPYGQYGYRNLVLGKNTNIEKILKFIFDGGESGRAWKEIHRFIVEDIKGLKQDLSDTGNRGYYSVIFSNFLPYFCEKDNKKWIINDPILVAYFSRDLNRVKKLLPEEVSKVLSNITSNDTRDLRDRIKLAKHPNISDKDLVKLSFYDTNEKVREEAQKNPRLKKIKGIKVLRQMGELHQLGII